ncbi:MAG: amidohydrolase [Ruthenibacterium sp.]
MQKQELCMAIDAKKEYIFSICNQILNTPELGYAETQTRALVVREMQKIGLTEITGCGITGVKACLRGKPGGVHIAIIGELDAVLSPQHPHADASTGAAHACGHNVQIGEMLGLAAALAPFAGELCADVFFFAVPAEEYIEINHRLALRNAGKIEFLGGKQQLLCEGAFDDIDLAMMVHAETDRDEPQVVTHATACGFIGKTVQFIGKEAHAGGAPYLGVNALNAAALAILAVHTQRETFRDEDHVRVHPIITKGGDVVNTVPADVRMESYVRAGNVAAMKSANATVNRAMQGAAFSCGADIKINDLPGYLPLRQNAAMSDLFAENAVALLGARAVERGGDFSGSTDMGDLSAIIPAIQPSVSGFSGALHSKNFTMCDAQLAAIVPAKLMAMTLFDLCENDAQAARKIIAAFPRKSATEFRAIWQAILQPVTDV